MTIYESSRSVGDTFEGTDAAQALIQTSSSGDIAALQALLSQPQEVNVAFENQDRIYSERRPQDHDEDSRQVHVMSRLNLEVAVVKAADNGHAIVGSALFRFALEHGNPSPFDPESAVFRLLLTRVVKKGDVEVFKAFVAEDPKVVNIALLHGNNPLDQAVASLQTELVAFLLLHGADPRPSRPSRGRKSGYSASLLAMAANAKEPRITELLLTHGVKTKRSGGLHRAAEIAAIEDMRVLIKHGADVDEQLSKAYVTGRHNKRLGSWTTMHFAASKGQVEAMELLESHGAKSDIKDDEGKTPRDLLDKV